MTMKGPCTFWAWHTYGIRLRVGPAADAISKCWRDTHLPEPSPCVQLWRQLPVVYRGEMRALAVRSN